MNCIPLELNLIPQLIYYFSPLLLIIGSPHPELVLLLV